MNQEQQREAIRLLRVVAAASMGRTDFNPTKGEWIGWQDGEMEGVANLKRDVRALLAQLRESAPPPEVGTRWKTTAKHLPEEGATVLGCWGIEGPGSMGVVMYSGSDHWHDPEDDEDDYRTPEHWMPLPDGPRLPSSPPQEERSK